METTENDHRRTELVDKIARLAKVDQERRKQAELRDLDAQIRREEELMQMHEEREQKLLKKLMRK